MGETWGASPADVVAPWCYACRQTDAGARPVSAPDCCCERVLQDSDLVAGSAGGVPCPGGGAEAAGAGAGPGRHGVQDEDRARAGHGGRAQRPAFAVIVLSRSVLR